MSTWLCVELICAFLGDVLCVKKDVMEPFLLATAALLCRLLKQTLMRVRWKAVPLSTILWKSFMASWTRGTTASSLLPKDITEKNYSVPTNFIQTAHYDLPQRVFINCTDVTPSAHSSSNQVRKSET